jgi:hypothetical protein
MSWPTHIRLWRAELELDETDLGLFDSRRTASRVDDVLLQRDAVDELGVLDGAADLFDDADVAQVDVVDAGDDESLDGVDSDRGEDGGVLRDNLRRC